jgi:oxygen-independent coproporphyrinogen-3 oxidase
MEKLAVYIHWPYCARICPYCDFNVYKRKTDDALLPAILADLKHWRDLSGPREITSIHFGGGTPSLMTATQVGAVVETVEKLWGMRDIEIALEANPHEMDIETWRAYCAAGLNRMSLGVQSFNDAALAFLGRDHDGTAARKALDLALEIFPSASADLIFGWAGQSPTELASDLSILLDAGTPHISTYQLTIEDGTAFARAEQRGQTRAIDAELSADFYDIVRGTLCTSGFDHYEVSNFAKAGHQSRHNLAYWRGWDYVGVGPGAHGRITTNGKRHATTTYLTPARYTKAVSNTGTGIDDKALLDSEAWSAEYLLMGLRIEAGISLSRYEALAGAPLNSSELKPLIEGGLLINERDRLKASQTGRLVLNSVTERLLLA